MNNVEKAVIIGFVFLLGTFGLFNIVDNTAYNTNLDEKSLQIISKYDNISGQLRDEEIISTYNGTQLNYEGVDPFYRTTAESKGSSNKFTDGWKIFAKFPLMLVSSLPFIEASNLKYIISLFLGLLGILGFIAIFKMWYGGNTNN